MLATTSPAITIYGAGLPHGAYRLDGAVSLREPGRNQPVHLAALAEGLLVQVLPGQRRGASGRLAVPVDADVVKPLPFGRRHIGRGGWGYHGLTDTQPPFPPTWMAVSSPCSSTSFS